MAKWCEKHDCDFVFFMGDNFYPQGVTTPNDERFVSSWKSVYNQPSLVDKTCYISLGNHDHVQVFPSDGREWNQVCVLM
jgi:tartrate-resistant acid phosphatase type 5